MGAKEDAEAWRALVESDPSMRDEERPKVSVGESRARGGLQGITSRFGDELAAGIETGASKVPGLRNLAQLAQPEGSPRVDDPNVTYEQRRDFKRTQNANAKADNPGNYLASEVGGGIAQAAIPGVGALGRGATAATRLAGATASGALGGLGGSEATDAAGMAKDAAAGGAGGLAAGVVGEGVRAVAKGAKARVEDRQFKSLGEDVRQPLKTALGDQSVRVRDVLKEPGIRAGLGNPGKMVQATEDGLTQAGTAARDIMQRADDAASDSGVAALRERATAARNAVNEMRKASSAPSLFEAARSIDAPQSAEPSLFDLARRIDAPVSNATARDSGRAGFQAAQAADRTARGAEAKALAAAEKQALILERAADARAKMSGGMRVKDVIAPLHTLQAEMARNSEHPGSVAALKRVIAQFESGLGSDPSQVVSSAKVREFLTKQLQKPGFARGLQADPPPAQEALRRAAGVVKDAIEKHVSTALGPEEAAALQRLNDRSTAYTVIQGAAQAQLDRGAQAPSAAAKLVDFAKHHGRFGGPAAMVGGGIGALAGGVPGAVIGSAAGAAAGEAVNRTLPVIDSALARDSSQLVARGVARTGRALSSAVQAHVNAGDPKAAIEQMGQEVYGQ